MNDVTSGGGGECLNIVQSWSTLFGHVKKVVCL
jgi:hypothetical protein